ncbi:glycosyltransferase family 2 protein [Thermoleptolyngbya sichuanensis A183]|uniref:Glycosyltransferase family 2 protein n=3 Tax=Thermoleptolyngbya TaxID=2303528 RepID=A0A6M8BPH6_9CYAN|nr:glycosyltransferase family 2 protein [Thermoleptolyngbya sichuanensis A183]
MVITDWVLLLLSGVVLVPCAVLLTECVMALRISQKSSGRLPRLCSEEDSWSSIRNDVEAGDRSFRFMVLMPAHNEELGISDCLHHLIREVDSPEQVLVVADNCTDQTAAIARSFGVDVIERQNPARLGKGYALDYGLRHLEAVRPDVVVLVDADCVARSGSIQRIVQLAFQENRPVQAVYLMRTPEAPSQRDLISALAFLFKNLVRPVGMAQLGLPCWLTGTGMAFPWSVIRQVSLSSGNLVEDMQMSVDLAIAGSAPLLCADAEIGGCLPSQRTSAKQQRTRWEHGHLQTLKTQVPRLLQAAIHQQRLDLLMLALDLGVPPLALLVLLWTASVLAAMAGFAVGGTILPLVISALAGAFLLVAVLLGWYRFGRSLVPLSAILAVPFYILWKIPLYVTFLFRPQTKWIRTDREMLRTAED